MIDRSNSRLNAIFALWFLVAGIVPACIVGGIGYYFQRQAMSVSAERELALMTHSKADQVNQYLTDQQKVAEAIGQQVLDQASSNSSATAKDRALASVVRDQGSSLLRGKLYGVTSSGSLVTQYPASTDASDLWTPTDPTRQSQIRFAPSSVFFAYHITELGQWIVLRDTDQKIADLLAEGFNYQTGDVQDGLASQGIGYDRLGKTADIFVADPMGTLLTQPLTSGSADSGSPAVPLQQWLAQSIPASGSISQVAYDGRQVMMHIEPIRIGETSAYIIATIDRSEVAGLLKDQERLQLLTYIGALILMLSVLYLFVGLISRILVKPIFKTITDITSSTGAIQTGIANAEETMVSQEAVANSLLTNYKEQLKNMKAVDTDGTKIAESLADISRQTAKAAESVQLIDALAVKGQQDAEEAKSSIASIKKLATAHEALIITLSQYSQEVDAIAADVRALAQATTYASLNATIEASSADRGMHTVSSLASEVGNLSLLSKEASEHINDLVKSIQTQLSQSKEASARERAEAAGSLMIINRALESLNRMSKDAMQIAQSVQAIDRNVVKQSASTKQIALRMTDLHVQAKTMMREATRIQLVSMQQKKGIKANSTAVMKLSTIVQRLGQLIGVHRS